VPAVEVKVANIACSDAVSVSAKDALVVNRLLRLRLRLLQPRPEFIVTSSATAATSSHWLAFDTNALSAPTTIFAQVVKRRINTLLSILS
jgi:hypothetical protein